MTSYRKQRFPMGYTFAKKDRIYKIVDVRRTYDNEGDMVDLQYVTQHTVCGQGVRSIMCDTEIARASHPKIFEDYCDKDFTRKEFKQAFTQYFSSGEARSNGR